MTRLYKAETAASVTALAQRIMETNLCKEVMFDYDYYIHSIPKSMTEPKYKFSRKWYTVPLGKMDWKKTVDCLDWCEKTFGQQPKNPDAWSRWQIKFSSIHFRDSKDYEWFMLRWS